MRAHMVCKTEERPWNESRRDSDSLFHKQNAMKWVGVGGFSRLLKVDWEVDTCLSGSETMLGGTEHKGFV